MIWVAEYRTLNIEAHWWATRAAGLIIALVLLALVSPAQSAAQSNTETSLGPSQLFEARGLLRSAAKIEYRTDLRAPVAQTPLREGQSFSKGDLLIAFDCKRYVAELKAAKAVANAAWTDYASKKRLLAHQAIGKDEVNLSAAQAGKAAAEVEVRQVVNQECEITAPFDGRIVSRNVNTNEYPPADSPMLVILDDRLLEIEIVAPSNWLTWLKTGQTLSFMVDETGIEVAAKLERIGAEVDPVSQTVKVFATLIKPQASILAGMSGTVSFGKGS